jgi:outer membrane protein TolC
MKAQIYIAALLACALAHAQQAMTFKDCLDKALKDNLALQSASYDEKIAVTKHLASYGKMLPNITGEVRSEDSQGFEINSHRLYENADFKEFRGTVAAEFNLFSGFSVLSGIRAARQQMEIAETNTERRRNDITIDLAQRFITILYLQEIIDANQQQIDASAKQLEMAQLKFDGGLIPESELFKIKAQKASEELTQLDNRNKLSDNMVSLKQQMNMPMDEEITLVKPDLELNELLAPTDNEFDIAKKAVAIQPAYKLKLLEEQKAKTERAIALSALLPSLTLRLQYRTYYDPNLDALYPYSQQIDETTQKQIRLYLTVPIFNGFQAQAKVKASTLAYKQAAVETKIEQNQLSKIVLKAVYDARTSLKKKEASSIAMDFSSKSYDADLLKFQVGKIGISELNVTKINFNAAQAELIQSKYELLFNNALIRFYQGEPFTL